MNILNQPFDTQFNTAPFSKIKDADFLPAFKKGIADAKAEIDAIVNNTDSPTFQNTIEALEFSGEQLDRISSIFFNLNSAETNETIQKIAQEVSPLLSEFSNDITLNEDLFKRVKSVYDQKETLNLSTEQMTLLEKKYKSFSRNGANLPAEKKFTPAANGKNAICLTNAHGRKTISASGKPQLLICRRKKISASRK